MKKRALLLSAFLIFPTASDAADDMLAAAMKRIKELEAANKAQAAEIHRLKSGPTAHASAERPSTRKSVAATAAPAELPPVVAIPAEKEPSLSGFYAGINGGYGGGDASVQGDTFDFFSPNRQLTAYTQRNDAHRFGGALAGGQIGYNYFFSNGSLVGGEVDVDWADISTKNNGALGLSSPDNGIASMSSDRYGLRWIGTARARLGYKIGTLVPYISGGLAFGGGTAQFGEALNQLTPFFVSDHGSSAYGNKVSVGWAAGAGVEYSVTDNISIKTEYLYTQIAGASSRGVTLYHTEVPRGVAILNGPSLLGGANGMLGFHQVRFGINYHLHLCDMPSVVAGKY